MNYGVMMKELWPLVYSTFVIWSVLGEGKLGEKVTSDEKKRSDLVIKFCNGILADHAARAVNGQPLREFDQVPNQYMLVAQRF
jgi:hypothetical protein